MEYQYSALVDPSTYHHEGLCDGVPLRVHLNPGLAGIGAVKAQDDWREHVGPLGIHRGVMGAKYSLVSVLLPECLPERLEIISYVTEIGFLHDDVTDVAGEKKIDFENKKMLDAFREGAETGTIKYAESGKRRIIAKMFEKMVCIDQERASKTMKFWAEYYESMSGHQFHIQYDNIKEYLEYRALDIGQMLWFGMLTFGMSLTIPVEETEICRMICQRAWNAICLTNDLFSWQKEHEAISQSQETDVVMGALSVLMEEHSISLEDATIMCRKLIKDNVAEYLRNLRQTKENLQLSDDLRRYVEALQYTISGNVVWGLDCPRYHPEGISNKSHLSYWGEGAAVKCGSTNGPDASADGNANGGNSSSAADLCMLNFDGVANEQFLIRAKKIIAAPANYLHSLPSKLVRDQLIDALNVWLQVPVESLHSIKQVIKTLHTASLMLDDVEDSSPLRRGSPSTHTIFGSSQTINAANYKIILALEEATNLKNHSCRQVVTDELKKLFLGQSMDLHWTYNLISPSIDDYMKMVDNKTGGLFRLASRLMTIESTVGREIVVTNLVNLIGRCFQVRDDYLNLVSEDYANKKGFCEDLDEGKYSLALIHTLLHTLDTDPQSSVIENILMQRRVAGKLTLEHKQLILASVKRTRSLDSVAVAVERLNAEIQREIEKLESNSGVSNSQIWCLVKLLQL